MGAANQSVDPTTIAGKGGKEERRKGGASSQVLTLPHGLCPSLELTFLLPQLMIPCNPQTGGLRGKTLFSKEAPDLELGHMKCQDKHVALLPAFHTPHSYQLVSVPLSSRVIGLPALLWASVHRSLPHQDPS